MHKFRGFCECEEDTAYDIVVDGTVHHGYWVYGFFTEMDVQPSPLGGGTPFSQQYILSKDKDAFADWNMLIPQRQFLVLPGTVCLGTGMCDMKGKEVFEYDKVVYDNSSFNCYSPVLTGAIVQRNGGLCFQYMAYGITYYRSFLSDDFFFSKCRVIGTMFDA